MARPAAIIALAERLRKQSHRVRRHDVIADLRLATWYLKDLAALKIAEEAEIEADPDRKHQLEQEVAQLRLEAH